MVTQDPRVRRYARLPMPSKKKETVPCFALWQTGGRILFTFFRPTERLFG